MASGLAEECQSVKGMPDILPTESALWLYLEKVLLELMHQHGYQQIRLPLLEKTALFKRAVGEVTDLVEKEMFSFLDEKSRSLSLRPEGTAGCVRASIEHGLLRNLPQRLWYLGPMFRYEAPQKGRQRQFHQLGIECFGINTWEIELEQIVLISRLWKQLGIADSIKLEINSLGTVAARKVYLELLTNYFKNHEDQLDQDSQRRLQTNPLRILDSKNPHMQDLLKAAPKIYNYLDQESLDNYQSCKKQLDLLGIKYLENPNIVRGLDYYTGMVWEWTSTLLGAQSAVCAGGRYDNLVEQLGGSKMPAVGLALGLERIILLLQQQDHQNIDNYKSVAYLGGYLICVGEEALQQKFAIAEKIRDSCPDFRLVVDLLGGNFKNQFKRADKSGAKIAIILGDDEVNTGRITVKYLREQKPQVTVAVEEFLKLCFE